MKLQVEKHYLCTWPDGDTRVVIVCSYNHKTANIRWVERLSQKPVDCVDMDELVPVDWLSHLPGEDEGR